MPFRANWIFKEDASWLENDLACNNATHSNTMKNIVAMRDCVAQLMNRIIVQEKKLDSEKS